MLEVFLDASYAIALSSSKDQYHEKAVVIADQLEAEGVRVITTRAIIIEIGNAMAKLRYRKAAVELLDSIEGDPNIEIIPVTEELYKRAFHLYRERLDKEWGITDCMSIVIMQDRSLTDVLTTDEHFQQAGFKALLK